MFVVFADTWKTYVATYCTKIAIKEILLMKTTTQTNCQVASSVGLQEFLTELHQVYEKSYPQHRRQFYVFIWKNRMFF